MRLNEFVIHLCSDNGDSSINRNTVNWKKLEVQVRQTAELKFPFRSKQDSYNSRKSSCEKLLRSTMKMQRLDVILYEEGEDISRSDECTSKHYNKDLIMKSKKQVDRIICPQHGTIIVEGASDTTTTDPMEEKYPTTSPSMRSGVSKQKNRAALTTLMILNSLRKKESLMF